VRPHGNETPASAQPDASPTHWNAWVSAEQTQKRQHVPFAGLPSWQLSPAPHAIPAAHAVPASQARHPVDVPDALLGGGVDAPQ
jgi:hypothetical protein